MQNKSKTPTPNKNTGITKVMPIILGAVSVFIAICLFFGNAGAFGAVISSFLRGLFGSGAYAIPVVVLLHAIFFKSDYETERLLSKVVLSFVAILIVSSIDYTVMYFGKELLFDPAVFYSTASCGGFIGGTVSFCIASLIGCVGIIILDVAVVAVSAIIFFGRKDSAARQGVLGVLGFVTDILAKIEAKIKKNRENKRAAKAENRRMETERRHSEFFNDNFFDTKGNMDEIRIRELGIHESRDKAKSERHPTLQSKVHNKSHVKPPKEDAANEKASSFKFDIAGSELKGNSDSGQAFFGATDKNYAGKHTSYGIDENADSVFTKDFDPFDFATGEKLVAKPSTKAQSIPRSSGVNEMIPPISSLNEKSVAEQKRREEFELRKRSLIASRAAEQKAAQDTGVKSSAAAASVSLTIGKPEVTMEFGSSEVEANASASVTSSPAPEHISLAAEETKVPENADENIDQAYEQIAEKVLKNNPAYAVSANKTTFTTTVHSSDTQIKNVAPEESVEPANKITVSEASFASVSENVGINEQKHEAYASQTAPSFRPYEPPTPDEPAAPVGTAGTILVTERNLVTPESTSNNSILEQELARYEEIGSEAQETPETGETLSESDTPLEENSAAPTTSETIVFKDASSSQEVHAQDNIVEEKETIFSFGDEDEQDIEEVADENADLKEIFGGIEDEETATDDAPIPPEEQNPDVIKQRAMFPFLDEEESINISKSETNSEAEKENSINDERDVQNEYTVAENAQEVVQPQIQEEATLQNQAIENQNTADEEPPFEIELPAPAPVPTPAPVAVVPVEEKPKKKDYSNFVFPPIDLLHEVDEAGNENTAEEIKDNADKLIDTLGSFGVTASIKGVDRGPRITRYEVVPAKGVKVSNIMNLADDIALNLAADGIRMEAPIPGKSAVGVEIPNKKSSIVRLRELIETDDFKNLKSKTSVCMGKDVAGQPVFADVAKMPHALIAGATGMGKSVCINSLMLSILYKARPDEVKFIMIDPKQVEFTMYNGIPHLLVPVVTDVKQAAGTLMWAVEEMERRYGVLQEQCVRNIDAYNEKIALHPELGEQMSRIIIVIDEFAELIMQAKNPVESLIIRIAQKARAAGIHLIIGTQKPVKEVITGLIKSNIPSKLSCKVASNRDSILIFDAAGAEKLLDRGDMLIAFANSLKPQRVQCAFVADEEVEAVMDYLKPFSDGSNYDESVMEEIRRAADKCTKKGGGDRDDDSDDEGGSYGEGHLNNKEFLDAVEIAVNTRKISTSLIQRKLSIGYGKAAKFIDIMEDMGIVGEANGSKPREVLLTADEWHEKLARTTYD